MGLQVRPILPRFGAELSGIDIRRPLDVAPREEILAACRRWGVCIFRNTGLDDESHIEFSRIFGRLELAPLRAGKAIRFGRRELFDVGNLDDDGRIKQDPQAIVLNRGNQLWHTDASFVATRSAYSLLHAYEVPSKGGETYFADTRSAYEDLPDLTKNKINRLEAVHTIWWSRKLAGYDISDEDVDDGPSAVQPLVLPHSSGRSSLYLAAHIRDIVGMERAEAQALIQQLMAWATQPQYVFSMEWGPGDLVIWDNLASMHRGGAYDELGSRRDLRRTTIRDPSTPGASEEAFEETFAILNKPAVSGAQRESAG